MIPQVSDLFTNGNWVFLERLITSCLSFLSVVAIARLMGPADYGAFSYVISVTSIFLAAGHLGLDGLLIKKFIEEPKNNPKILGTVCILKLGFLITSGIIVIGYGYMNPVHTETERLLFSAVGIMFLAAPFTSILNAWLQSQKKFKNLSLLRIFTVSTGTSLKLILIYMGFSIEIIGLAHASIFALESLLIYSLFHFLSGPRLKYWQFSANLSKKLLSEGASLFVGTVLAMVYFNIDIMMLRFYFNEAIVGKYSLVPQIMQALQILPFALTLVVFPDLLRISKLGESAFLDACKPIYGRILMLALGLGVITFLLGGWLLIAVFGEAYQSATSALKIACFALPFLFMRHLTLKVFIALKLGNRFALLETMGLTINVIANLYLIPIFAGVGAAASTVLALCISSVLGLFVFRDTRALAKIIVSSSMRIPGNLRTEQP